MQNTFDPVSKPNHYADRKYEVIDIIRDSMSKDAFKGYLHGNVIKYVMRYEKKGGLQDLEKAKVYLGWLMDEVAPTSMGSKVIESVEKLGVPVYRDEEKKFCRSLLEIMEDMTAKWNEANNE